ncbi:MAG: aconitate hydratase, partial [Deltaproteobacteria bacterium]|nr:aconitate hydratase [Deltaproteobacteria bacterium]
MNRDMTPERAEKILDTKRRLAGRGLSYAEKLLFLHQAEDEREKILVPGRDTIKLFPDRVAMQDATAQMAMLQFIQAQRKKSQVDATIHCDHLITAENCMEPDLKEALHTNKEIY